MTKEQLTEILNQIANETNFANLIELRQKLIIEKGLEEQKFLVNSNYSHIPESVTEDYNLAILAVGKRIEFLITK